MKYLKTKFDLTSDEVNPILESLGYDVSVKEVELPNLIFEKADAFYEIDPEVYDIEDDLFLKVTSFSDEQTAMVNEDTNVVDTITWGGKTYTIDEELYENEGDTFIHLIPESVETEEEKSKTVKHIEEGNKLQIGDEEYFIVEDEDDADMSVYLQETDDEGEFNIVDDEADATYIAYLKSVEVED